MSNAKVAELLVKSGAYTDLPNPVVLASGQLGIYYINTEKLLGDGGKWKEFGDDPVAMYAHLRTVMEANPDFREVIGVLKSKAEELFSESSYRFHPLVSGGQRRDWLFSMPVASQLGISHLTQFKKSPSSLIWSVDPSIERPAIKSDYKVVHIVDLITEGSSIYQEGVGEPTGWLPNIQQLSNGQGRIDGLLAVVDRLQGGREMLASQGVELTSFVEIDKDFLEHFSADPARALAYHADPTAWSEEYLGINGAGNLFSVFDPEGGKLDRAGRFFDRYQRVLNRCGWLGELEGAVQEAYRKPINEILRR